MLTLGWEYTASFDCGDDDDEGFECYSNWIYSFSIKRDNDVY